jgi:hypothetical protein
MGLCTFAAHAQWTSDPSTNTPVAIGGIDNRVVQAKPRLAALGDGTNYITWWQSEDAPVYWSLRMNRLSRAGTKMWMNDLVVSDKPATSAQGVQLVNSVDYDLKADSFGAVALTFTDFRAMSNRNVVAYRVSATGDMLWGADGAGLTSDGNFKRDPRIVETSAGSFAIAWFSQGNFTSSNPPSLRLQVLSAAGVPVLVDGGIAIASAATTSRPPDRFELVASDNGSVIAAWIKEFSSSSSASRWVVAQKFAPDASNTTYEAKWNSGEPVIVCDQQIPFSAAYPRVAMRPTPDGGCVLAWHDQRAGAGTSNVFAQRLSSTGAALWSPNGVSALAASPGTGVLRQDAAVLFDGASESTWLAWRELDNNMGLRAIAAQRFDSTGQRVLGDSGTLLTPFTTAAKPTFRIQPSSSGLIAAWFEEAMPGPGQVVHATRVGGTGAATWTPPTRALASTMSVKNFARHPLDTTAPANIALDGFSLTVSYPTGAVVAFQDARADADDVFVQQLSSCGSLGAPSAADFDDNGARSIDDIFIYLNAWFAQNPRTDVDAVPGLSIDDLFVFLNLWFAGC